MDEGNSWDFSSVGDGRHDNNSLSVGGDFAAKWNIGWRGELFRTSLCKCESRLLQLHGPWEWSASYFASFQVTSLFQPQYISNQITRRCFFWGWLGNDKGIYFASTRPSEICVPWKWRTGCNCFSWWFCALLSAPLEIRGKAWTRIFC